MRSALRAASTALLIMDVQLGIVDRYGSDEGYLARLATAITAARSAGIAVIYVTVGFRPGYPEVSERNKSFAAIAGTGRLIGDDPAAPLHPAIAPAAGEVMVTKRRVSAFTGSDLEVLLRSSGKGGPAAAVRRASGAARPHSRPAATSSPTAA